MASRTEPSQGFFHLATLIGLGALAWQPYAATAQESATQQRDSAGIRIVDNVRPEDGSRLNWRIGPRPEVSIGKVTGEEPYLLTGASDATRLSDRRIVVVNRLTRELRVFDEAGIHLDTWGGTGEGPGEFTAVTIYHIAPLAGDSVVVWGIWHDPFMTVFDPAGNYERSFRPERSEPGVAGGLIAVAVTPGGAILAGPNRISNLSVADEATVELWNADGELLASLGSHAGKERIHGVENTNTYDVIFGRSLLHQPWGDLIVVGPNTRYEIKAYAQDGSLARIVRRDHVTRAPTRAHVAAYAEASVARIPTAEERESALRSRLSRPVADQFPAFVSVMSDAQGHLWVQEFEPPDEELPGVIWTVFDPEGRALGFVETPEELEIYEIGEDYILGRTTDELDVEYIQVWPLDRSGT